MRYPDAFAVSYQVDGSLDECLIPKLTLQPLVENAVCHGIIPTAQPGAVKITAEQSGERIRLIVEDNGIGMEEAKMRTIGLDSLEENSNSFGLRGTIKRLKLYFGDGFEHTILSWPGEGTVVTLLFPSCARDGHYVLHGNCSHQGDRYRRRRARERLLPLLVDWFSIGYEFVGEAADGFEALDLMETAKPTWSSSTSPCPIWTASNCRGASTNDIRSPR